MDTARQDQRKALLKQLITDLHGDVDLAEMQRRFAALVGEVSAVEIAQIEQQLISEGLPVEEVRAMCDVHVAVFEQGLQSPENPELTPGHPVHTFKYENFALQELLTLMEETVAQLPGEQPLRALRSYAEQMMQFDRIYLRKEHLLFPFLEKHGVSGPTSVMWGIHDDVRNQARALRSALQVGSTTEIRAAFVPLAATMRAMIYKEENILYPTALKVLSAAEWLAIRDQSDEFGYCLIRPGDAWQPDVPEAERITAFPGPVGYQGGDISLEVGSLSPLQLAQMLRHLPVDLTFVDETDTVRFYSESLHGRIFARTPSVIGRKVQNCHPPTSVHIVNAILEGFRAGRRSSASFWITLNERFVHIRYFAVRDPEGSYLGALEMVQDVTEIRALEGATASAGRRALTRRPEQRRQWPAAGPILTEGGSVTHGDHPPLR